MIKYFLMWFFLQAFQMISVALIQHGKMEQHDWTDSKLTALAVVICYSISDIRKDIQNKKQ